MSAEVSVDPWTPQEEVTAAALRRVHARLNGSACTAYLITSDGRMLVAAMTVDAPLSFAVPSGFLADDLAWPTVRAFHAGKSMAYIGGEMHEKQQEWPYEGEEVLPKSSVTLAIPHLIPLTVASSPIQTARHKYGMIVVHWTPPQPIAPSDAEFLRQEAGRLATELESIGDGHIETPAAPVFITRDLAVDEVFPGPVRDLLCDSAKFAADRGSYIHQLQRLATELVTAMHAEDVLAIARDRVVRPFGGRGFAVCFAEGEHLHVAGAADLPHDVLHDLEGTLLSADTPVAEAMRHARARISADGARPIGYFPFLQGGDAVGCCVVEFADSRKIATPSEVTLLVQMLDQVGQSIARAKSVEAESALARSIQRSLLPSSFPHVPEMVVTARYRSATSGVDVGGDWYDVIPLPDGRIGLVIGDVEGHSLEAAAVMGQLRSGVRAYAIEGHEPAVILERSNQLLMGLDTELYATCCCMVLDTATGLVTIASAGHPSPLITHESTGVIEPDLPAEPPLGISARMTYQQTVSCLPPGSVVALFTDGLMGGLLGGLLAGSDAQSPDGRERLRRTLVAGAEDDLEVMADRIIADSHGEHGREDDVALLLARFEGAQPRGTVEVARMFVDHDDLRGVAEVRSFLRDLLQSWDRAPALDDMQVMASEVVTNALIHAHSKVDLRLRRYANRIRVEVQDSDPNPPIPTSLLEDEAGNEEAEGGRGLLIVEALAHAWGSSPAGRGKITWFEL
jgi:serine phosphatase RsbU (regulator of sigma subunit)/anti-sigma regulatory factor (Ser/Thr protein kinase)